MKNAIATSQVSSKMNYCKNSWAISLVPKRRNIHFIFILSPEQSIVIIWLCDWSFVKNLHSHVVVCLCYKIMKSTICNEWPMSLLKTATTNHPPNHSAIPIFLCLYNTPSFNRAVSFSKQRWTLPICSWKQYILKKNQDEKCRIQSLRLSLSTPLDTVVDMIVFGTSSGCI